MSCEACEYCSSGLCQCPCLGRWVVGDDRSIVSELVNNLSV